MGHPIVSLEDHFKKLSRLQHALTFLQWDQLVMMPPGGNENRAESIAELVSLHHEFLTKPIVKDLLEQAKSEKIDAVKKRSLMEMERVWQRAICIPPELVKAKSLAGSRCEHGWRTQRKENDWQGFLTNFKEVVNLSREEAKIRQANESERFATAYDSLLDLYCTGDSTLLISEVFAGLKKDLPNLIELVVEKQKNKKNLSLSGEFPVEKQKELNEKLMEILGFDFSKGRLDVSMHPFSTGDRGDHRITTRFHEEEFAEALQATAHETGHASYENGLPDKWDALPVGQARNLCIHESQSLLFEKQLFLSRPFIHYFSSVIANYFPIIQSIDPENLWQAFTKVEPSLIRVEADEVTYPMHVILRYEIESDLINEKMEPEDIPDAWDEKMNKYLGISTGSNFTDGCLQDIHWTDGSFGYFPSYTLGAVNAAQIFAVIRREFPDWQEKLNLGDTGFIRVWLTKQIWERGSSLDSQEIIETATGQGTNSDFLLQHIRARYLNEDY